MAENQYGFPTEVLSLPSQGLLYPEDSPLRSGTIDVKYMTAKEEDILTSTNLIQQGKVIDKLLESIIANRKIKAHELLVGDKNALMVGTRILGYGKDYRVEITDPDTQERVETSIDLTELKHKKISKKLYKNGNKFEFKLLTQQDENEIDKILQDYKKVEKLTGVSNELTTRFKYYILSVDGQEEQHIIDKFVDNEFLALDARALRKYVADITPDIELKFDYTSQTGNLHKIDVPLGIEFFWPAAE
jgi:hypothetical protein